MGVVFTNNAETTLAAAITSTSATSISVTSSSTFPAIQAGEHFYATLDDGTNNEIVKVTGVSGTTWTVVRASDSTTARTFANGITVQLRATAALLTDIQENIAAKSANQTVYNATAASNATAYDVGVNPGVEANAMVFLDGVMQHHDTFSFSGSTLTFDAAPTNGTKIEVIVDNLINLQSSNLTTDTFTATSGQTAFVLSDAPAAENNLIVFIDGVFQDQGNYSISNHTLTLATGAVVGRTVTVYIINPVNIGTPSDGTVTGAKLSGNITMPGTLTVGAFDVAFDSPTFVVDNANSRVGLGTATPSVPVDIVGEVKISSHLNMPDNAIAKFGAGSDLQIYHDGSNSRIVDSGTGSLYLQGQQAIILANADASEFYATFDVNGASALRYDNAQKLATTSTGIDVTGTVVADGIQSSGDFAFTAADGMQISAKETIGINIDSDDNDSSRAFTVTSGSSGSLENLIIASEDAGVTLYHDNSVKLATTSSGIDVTGTAVTDGLTVAGNAYIGGGNTFTDSTSGYFFGGSGSFTNGVYGVGTNNMAFNVNGSEKLRIDSQGQLTQTGATNTSIGFTIKATATNDYVSVLQFNDNSGVRSSVMSDHYNNALIFKHNSNVERMRIDSSGTLLVGTTDGSGAGLEISKIHGVRSTVTNNVAALFDRLSSDGDIALFRKDGTTVGSIGTEGGDMVIGTGDTAVQFADSLDCIRPFTSSGSGNGGRDNAIDLGASGQRFKDLHLSGTAEVGNVVVTGGVQSFLQLYSSHAYVNNRNWRFVSNLYGNGNWGGFSLERSTGTGGTPSEAMFGITLAGLVGIGVGGASGGGQPAAKLHIKQSANKTEGDSHFRIEGSGYSGFHWLNGTAYYIGQNSNGRQLRMYSGSNTGVGVYLTNGGNSWASYSDERLKENIQDIGSVAEKIKDIRCVTYNRKDVDDENKHDTIGFIAQDFVGKFDQVLDESKVLDSDEETRYSIRYTETIPILMKAIQEQQTIIDDLKTRIETLEG